MKEINMMELVSQNCETILSRKQMKRILGGNESSICECKVGLKCSLYDSASGQTYSGECDAGFGGGSGGYMPCGCSTSFGVYTPNSGQSHCCR